jgi:hypothetical protein
MYSRRNGDTLIKITAGPDRGQKVLRLAQSVYLYYPDAEQIIRMQGASLKDSMFGSNFSYEDLTGDKSTQANYNVDYQGRETIDGVDCYILMCTAKKRSTVYQKIQYYVAVNGYYAKRIVIFSASGIPIRQIDSNEIQTVNGKAIPVRQTVTVRDALVSDGFYFTLEKAYVKTRLPGFPDGSSSRLSFGKMPIAWGQGTFFNAGDILFGSMPNQTSLFSSEYRTDTDWMGVFYLPLGDWSFVETAGLPPMRSGETGRGGGRFVLTPGWTILNSIEAGYLYDTNVKALTLLNATTADTAVQ